MFAGNPQERQNPVFSFLQSVLTVLPLFLLSWHFTYPLLHDGAYLPLADGNHLGMIMETEFIAVTCGMFLTAPLLIMFPLMGILGLADGGQVSMLSAAGDILPFGAWFFFLSGLTELLLLSTLESRVERFLVRLKRAGEHPLREIPDAELPDTALRRKRFYQALGKSRRSQR